MYDAQKLIGGDEDALADAVDELAPALVRYAAGILLNLADAEDAVQEAFVKVWRKRHTIRDAAAFEPFLRRAVYHAAVDILRSRRLFVEPPRPADDDPDFLSDESRAALRSLSPADRALVYGRAVEEKSYAELAAGLKITETAARKRYERAKIKLAARLAKNSPSEAEKSNQNKEKPE